MGRSLTLHLSHFFVSLFVYNPDCLVASTRVLGLEGRGLAGIEPAIPRRSGMPTGLLTLRHPLSHAPHQNAPLARFSAGTTST